MIQIRHESPADYKAIDAVNLAAFGQEAEGKLVNALRNANALTLSLVAIDADDQVIGHIAFSPATIESDDKIVDAIGLAPMSVLPAHQKSGIGTKLVETGLSEIKAAGHAIVVVLGHPNYYPRFGFEPSSPKGIPSEYDVPDDVFMIKELESGALDGVRGIAKYRPEFNDL